MRFVAGEAVSNSHRSMNAGTLHKTRVTYETELGTRADKTVFLGLVMAITGRFWGPAAETMVFVVMGIVLIFKPIEV